MPTMTGQVGGQQLSLAKLRIVPRKAGPMLTKPCPKAFVVFQGVHRWPGCWRNIVVSETGKVFHDCLWIRFSLGSKFTMSEQGSGQPAIPAPLSRLLVKHGRMLTRRSLK